MNLQIIKTSQKIIQSIRSMDIYIQKNVSFTLAGFFLKGWNSRTHLNIFLEGEYSRFNCSFCILGSKKNIFPFDISVIHRAPHSVSSVVIRSVLFDESKVDSRGLVRVEKDAIDSTTSFSHHALLFSEKSTAIVFPALEILTDSVAAHHAASVAQLDADSLWYLMSRGIPRKNAELLLVQGFFDQDIQKIENHSLQEIMRKKLRASHAIYA